MTSFDLSSDVIQFDKAIFHMISAISDSPLLPIRGTRKALRSKPEPPHCREPDCNRRGRPLVDATEGRSRSRAQPPLEGTASRMLRRRQKRLL
jgi:hypothetical protein